MRKNWVCMIWGILFWVCLTGCAAEGAREEAGTFAAGKETIVFNTANKESTATEQAVDFSVYKPYGLDYNADKNELSYKGQLVRWFEDYYPVEDNICAGVDFLNENGTVDVYATRDFTETVLNHDGSSDPCGKLTGVKEFAQEEFDARDIDAIKNQQCTAISGTPWSAEEMQEIAEEYEAFGVTYDAAAEQWYFQGEKVRYFEDILTSNGESLSGGKFQGTMRSFNNDSGVIDIFTVRDFDKINSEGFGTLIGIEKCSQ